MIGKKMIWILLVLLIIIALIVCYFTHGDLISPAFLFCATFLFAVIWAIPFCSEWSLKLHENTLYVILGGVITFVIVCTFSSKYTVGSKKLRSYGNEKNDRININFWKLLLYFIIEVLTIVYTYYLKLQFAGGSFITLFATMSSYRVNIMNGGDVLYLPQWLDLLNSSVIAAGYWFVYVVVNNWIISKKLELLPTAIFITSIVNTILSTSRGRTFEYLICAMVYYLILERRYNQRSSITKMSTIIRVSVLLLILVFSFQMIANFLGRGTEETGFDYIVRYCGAQIANLDSYLQGYRRSGENFQSQTFYYVIQWIGSKFGNIDINYVLDLPFRKVNGHNLGNVYTTFYPFVYDYGYIGVPILTSIMAFISQRVYKNVQRTKFDCKPSKYIVFYGMICSTLIFSFFSNKFYETIFNPSFVYTFIFWVLFDWFFCSKAKRMVKFLN